MSTPTSTTVYTDGACQGNPGPGGWAWAVPDGDFRSGAAHRTTNQRMELMAVLDGVTTLRGRVRVVSDSLYVVNCFRQKWWVTWLKNGWRNSQRKDVANRDLWQPLIEEYRADEGRLSFDWVKGHSGDRMNDLVDRLAVEAADRQEGRSGTGSPPDLGPADRAGRGSGPTAPDGAGVKPVDPEGAGVAGAKGTEPVTGHRLVVTGLRPPALGGWDDNPVAASVRRRLAEILVAKLALHPDLVVLTGLGLGTEQLAAEAAAGAGIAYVAVLAFPHQDRVWPAPSCERFALLLAGASEVIVVKPKPPVDKTAAGRALARRDEWLAANADEAVVVWDEADPLVGRTARALERRLGDEQVWTLVP